MCCAYVIIWYDVAFQIRMKCKNVDPINSQLSIFENLSQKYV